MSDASPGYPLSGNLEDSPARGPFWESHPCRHRGVTLNPHYNVGQKQLPKFLWKRLPSSRTLALRRQREPRRPMSIYARQSAAKHKPRLLGVAQSFKLYTGCCLHRHSSQCAWKSHAELGLQSEGHCQTRVRTCASNHNQLGSLRAARMSDSRGR